MNIQSYNKLTQQERLGKVAFQERLNKFQQLAAKNPSPKIEAHAKQLGSHINELKTKYENLGEHSTPKPIVVRQLSTRSEITLEAPIPKLSIEKIQTPPTLIVEEAAAPIEGIAKPILLTGTPSPEFPDHKIERKKSFESLIELHQKLTEKDSNLKSKSRSGYYFTFEEGKFDWKLMSNFPKLIKSERKQLRIALETLLDILTQIVDQHKLVEFTSDNDTVPLQALLLRVVDYPNETPPENRVCVHFLNREKNRDLRQAIIKFLHKCTYYQPINEAKEIKNFLDKSYSTLSTLIIVLSGMQLEAISKETPKIITLGKEKLKATSSSENIPQRETVANESLKRILSNDVISPRLCAIVSMRRQHMREANELFKALRTGLEYMRESGKNRFVKDIGISSAYNQLSKADGNAYLLKVLGKPEELFGCYDEVSTVPLSQSLKQYVTFIENYLEMHRQFESSLGMRGFLKKRQFAPEKTKKIKDAYRGGDYGECLRVIFHVGGITLQLKSLLKDIARRSVERLEQLNVKVEIHKDFSRYEWRDLARVFRKLEKEFTLLKKA